MSVVGNSLPLRPIPDVVYVEPARARAWLDAGAWLELTVGETIERAARERADTTAIVDDHSRVTYAELERRSATVAARLLALGLQPGDRVLIQLGIGTTAVVALLGLIRAGLVPVCAVPQYRAYEMRALGDLSGARAHLVEVGAGSADLVAFGRALRQECTTLEHLIVAGGPAPRDAVALEGEPPDEGIQLPAVGPLDVVTFQLSGGTTGVPKIIPRFHAEYLGSAAACADRMRLGPEDVLLWSLPVSHNAGMLVFLIPTLLRGSTLVLQGRFQAESFLETVARERVTVSGSVGPIAPRLLDCKRPQDFDLSSLRLFIALNRAADIERHLGVPTTQMFGMTEGLVMLSPPGAPAQARHQTVGYPVSPHDEVRVLVPGEERESADGEIGELCFRGPSTLPAYYGNPQATAAAFTTDGFLRSGDLVRAVRVGEIRCYSFEGRNKDNIDRGGEKFGTEEIESLLAGHPAIQEARVVGMPDHYMGERACAFVITRAGLPVPTLLDVGEFLLARGLAKFKLPERIEQVQEMPVTAVGKLDRSALRQRIVDILATERERA
jgi:pyochelin biosynthesis protein PchD